MKRTSTTAAIGFALYFVSATAARAELIGVFGPVTISESHVPTPSLPGFSTWTLNASSSRAIRSFDFVFPFVANYGFFGPMNQVHPFGIDTPFNDLASVPGLGMEADSHFNFLSTDVSTSTGNVDSSTLLRATAGGNRTQFGHSVDFVQVVIADGDRVDFRGTVAYEIDEFPHLQGTLITGNLGPIPEPDTIFLAGAALATLLGFRRPRCAVAVLQRAGWGDRSIRFHTLARANTTSIRRTLMFRNGLSGILAVLAVAASSPAAVLISASGVPTIGLPGYATFTVTASTDDGKQIQGFDFAAFPGFGLFGPMNQVNPAGIPTVFQDNNAFFPFVGADVSQDSQFLFNSFNVVIPSGFVSESATQLKAIFASGTPLGTSVPFVQLAIPPLATVQARGQIQTVSVPFQVFDNNVAFSITNPFPEPSTLSLLGLAVVGGCGFIRRRRGSRREFKTQ